MSETPHCPSCRRRRLPGFMVAIVGAQRMPIEDAPEHISWPLICSYCGYQDEFAFVANPVPVPLATPAPERMR